MIELKLRRGTDAERAAITPASGEPVWTTDDKELWVGDGATAGGVLIGPAAGAAGNSFETINCPAGTDPVADSATDTLNLASGTTALTITGDSATDTVTFAVADVGAASGLMTAAQSTKLAGVETGADVTDAANVDAAGAVMNADYNAQTILAATIDDTPAALTVGEQTIVGRKTGGNIAALTGAEVLSIAGGAAASHTHAAGDITSGTLVHERGGLEADVSAYSGLVKIAAGATSAVTIGIASANALTVDAAAGAPADDEYARFTANGIEGRTEAEFKADFNLEIGTDVAAQSHVSTASGVHGVTGSVVGTTDSQALTTKDLTAETNKLHLSKGITVENPVSGDVIPIYMNERAIKVKGVSFASAGGTSVAFTIKHHTAIADAGTTIHTDTCASATPEFDVTPSAGANFDVATDQILNLVVGTVTLAVTMFHVTIEFDEA